MNSAPVQSESAASELMTGLEIDQVTALLQDSGYRVERAAERDGAPVLRSATGGLAFHISFSNPSVGDGGRYMTARFFAVLQVQGELPLSIVNGWNTTMRFGRLHLSGGLLVLDMDVLAVGGMSPAQFIGFVQIWDRLAQGVIGYLRDVLPKVAANEPSVPEQQAAAG